MHRFEHRRVFPLRIGVRTRDKSQSTANDASQIGQNVAEQIRGHDHIKRLGAPYKVHRCRIGVLSPGIDGGIVTTHLFENLVPEHVSVPLRVGLGNHRQPSAAAGRHFEPKPQNPFDAPPGVNGSLQREFLRLAHLEPAARINIFPLRVLPDDHEIDVFRTFIGQHPPDTRIKLHWAHAGVLIERLPNFHQRR